MLYVEEYAGDAAYSRTWWTTIAPGATFSNGHWETQDAAPLDDTDAAGLAIAYDTGTASLWLARPDSIELYPFPSATLDVSAYVLEATIDERSGLDQRGELVLDNAAGTFAGPPDPIALQHDVDLAIGYDAASSIVPRQSITGWRYERRGGVSVFVLELAGNAYWLGQSRPRTTITHDNYTAVNIMRAAAARAGLRLSSSGGSTRATTEQFDWAVHPHNNGLSALLQVMDIVPDLPLSAGTFTVRMYEPLTADSVDYDYVSSGHRIYESVTHNERAASLAEAIGADDELGQDFDFTELAYDKPITSRRRDAHSASGADAEDYAEALLRKAQLARDLGHLVTAPHCGLEVGDVVQYSDVLVHDTDPLVARVAAIKTTMRRRHNQRALYEQRVRLAGL
jgi:hypothetical protein